MFVKFAAVFAPPQRLRNQRIGEHQLRFHYVVERQQDFRILARPRLAETKTQALALRAEEFAAEAPAAVDRRQHLDVGDMAGITFEIRPPHQRPVDAR